MKIGLGLYRESLTPDNFRFAPSPTTNSLGDLPWWEVFKDGTLQDLVRSALTNNYDLKQASLVIFAALAVLTIPVYLSGNAAADALKKQPGWPTALVDSHEGAAVLARACSGDYLDALEARQLPANLVGHAVGEVRVG